MSKKGKSVAKDAKSLSAPSPIQGVSKEPRSSYAQRIINSKNYPKKAKFKKEYVNVLQGRRYVEVKYPSRDGRVLVKWSFDLKGEAMRKAAIERHARERLYPRVRRRFPRFKLFPRLSKEDKKLLEKGKLKF
jgi:hypothetical protein